jgi:Nuclear pore assembly and biogenesis
MDQNYDLPVILNYIQSTLYYSIRTVAPTIKNALKSNPDLTSILILLIILYVSLLILGHVTRMMFSFVTGIIKLAIICLVLIAILWVAQRGVPGALSDAYQVFDNVDKTLFMKGTSKYINRGMTRLLTALYSY